MSGSVPWRHLPHAPGVYLMRDKAGHILYIGKAVDLRKRVTHYFRPARMEPKTRALVSEIQHIDYITAVSEREALVMEQRLISRHKPPYNTQWTDDKSFPYVKVSLKEDFPRIYLTRKRERDGAAYFGPYPLVSSIRRLLRWIWRRKLFPLRPCDLEFSEGALPPYSKVQSCLYLHTGECPAPCVGKISKTDYRTHVDRVRLFFEGRQPELLHQWKKQMERAAKNLDFETAAHLRDNVAALEHMSQPVTFRALRENDVWDRIENTQILQELQKALNLPRPPLWIECFDISHSQGSDTVASLVVFNQGRPDKSHYRKFNIKTVAGVDDFASMEEVVGRRYRRVKEEGSKAPDLILIDGGPGQLSAALKALKAVGLRSLPVAALAKQEEEIFLPGQTGPLRLPQDSPALQLLQQVRDEAHRFAVTFHRSRRAKAFFSARP